MHHSQIRTEKTKSHGPVTQSSVKYKLVVEGKIEGQGEEEFIHTYDCDKKPTSQEEAYKIAGDFVTIEKMFAEEVTTTVRKQIVPLR